MENDAECGSCRTPLEDDRARPVPDRKPCRKCGSTERRYRVVATFGIGFEALRGVTASASLNFEAIAASATLILKAVVLTGAATTEGLLIEAVTEPWFDIAKEIEKDPDLVFKIAARKWEEIVAGAYKRAGFDEVTLTPSSGDLGRDVIAVKRGLGTIRVIDQVKAYKAGHLVTANDVRALMGVLQTDGASKGFVTTTSDFAPRLREDPLIKPLIPSRLALVNGVELIARLRELASRREK
jgi:restriction system protein